MRPERWATFDCYGTLVDWNAGIGGELRRLFGDERAPHLLERYHAPARPTATSWPRCSPSSDRRPRPSCRPASATHSPAERGQPAPTRELPDLNGLADVLDELVP